MKNSVLYVTLCGIIWIASCKKEALNQTPAVKKTPGNYIKFSNEALKYVQLPLKTFFIYKDSVTGTLDSVVVTQCDLEKKVKPAHSVVMGFFGTASEVKVPDYYYEIFSLTLSTFKNSLREDWFTSHDDNSRHELSLYSSVDSSMFLQESKKPGDSNYTAAAFTFLSGSNYNDNSQYPGITKIPTLTVEGKTYSNVIRITQDNSSGSNPNLFYKKTDYYWAKGIGIIKREVVTKDSAHSWTLLRNG